MAFGEMITVSNEAEKTRLYLYPIGYEPYDNDYDSLNWEQFTEMSELITHHAMLGHWPLAEIKLLTYYKRVDIEPIEVLCIGKRNVSIGVTGETVIVYDDEYYDRQYMSGEKKFIPFYSLELLLCVKNGRTNPFFTFQHEVKPKLCFNHKVYKRYMDNNIVLNILCEQHENHRMTWDDHHKKYDCDLCYQVTISTSNDDEIPF